MGGDTEVRRWAVLALILAAACRGPEPPPAPGGRVENPQLGIALASVPHPFQLQENRDATLRLTAPGPRGAGVLDFELGPVESAGVNLVAAVRAEKARFESLPDGEYFGNRELVTPIGTAYTARGSYRSDGGIVEETRILALHPLENRLLTLIYRYPTGESSTRVNQLLEILGEVEGLTGGPEGPS